MMGYREVRNTYIHSEPNARGGNLVKLGSIICPKPLQASELAASKVAEA